MSGGIKDAGRAWNIFTGLASVYLMFNALGAAREAAASRKAKREEAIENPRRRRRPRRRNAYSYDDLV